MQVRQENKRAIRKFECVVMHLWYVLVDLSKVLELVLQPKRRDDAHITSAEKASSVPGRMQTAVVEIAITDLPSTLGSWPAICTTTPLAPAIDPNTMKARASPALRRKVDDRQKQPNSGCTLYRMASTPPSPALDNREHVNGW
jgi:hypothetical protein